MVDETPYKIILKLLNEDSHTAKEGYEMNLFSALVRQVGEKFFNETIYNQYFNKKYTDILDEDDNEFGEDWYRFHKSIRQTDFTDDGYIDSVWWNFIKISDIPYRYIRRMADEIHYNF